MRLQRLNNYGYYVKLYEVYKASIDHRYQLLLVKSQFCQIKNLPKFSYLKLIYHNCPYITLRMNVQERGVTKNFALTINPPPASLSFA